MGVFRISTGYMIACLLASASLSAQSEAAVLLLQKQEDGVYQVTEKNSGITLYSGKGAEVSLLNGRVCKIFLEGRWYLVTAKRGLIREVGYQQIRHFQHGRAAFRREDRWGFLDEQGQEIIAPLYSSVFDFQSQGAVVFDGGDWRVIDMAGNRSNKEHDDLTYIRSKLQYAGLMHIDEQVTSNASSVTNDKRGSTADQPYGPVTSGGDCPPNIAFENGRFDFWEAYTGYTTCVSGVNRNNYTPSSPAYFRHTMLRNTGAAVLDPYGFFNIQPPDGSEYFVLLGNDVNGAQSEKLRYKLEVPAGVTNYSIRYNYAVVFEDPSHERCEQPRFSAKLFDPATNSYLPCGTYEHIADETIPGFYNSPLSSMIKVKPWSEAFINLSAYAGKTLYLEFSNSDCTQGGHWGYSYLDVNNICNLTAEVDYQCVSPNKTTLIGPSGFKEYKWWNQGLSASLGSSQKIVLNPGPAIGTTMWVEVLPYSGQGCRDTLPVIIAPVYPVAAFQSGGPQCLKENRLVFTSSSVSKRVPIADLFWTMGDETSYSGPTISHPYSSSGDFNISLIAVDQNGCKDTAYGRVRIHPDPVSAVASNRATTFCAGDSIQLVSQSSSSGGIITQYQWLNNGIVLSQSQQTSIRVYQSGQYQLKVTDANGCTDTSSIVAVYAHPLPEGELQLPSASFICEGSETELRIFGNAASYQWLRNGFAIPQSNSPQLRVKEEGTYTVEMTSTLGCKAVANGAAYIKLRTAPKTDFMYTAYCRGIPIQFNQYTDTTRSGSVSWSWDFGDGKTSDREHPVHIYDRGTMYAVRLSLIPVSCPALTTTVTKVVNVEDPLPGIRYNPVNTVSNTNTVVRARNFGSEYLWFPSTGLRDARKSQVEFKHDQPVEYTIRIKTAAGCLTHDTLLVRMFKQADIMVPTAFTPNGDGHNDRLDIFPVGLRSFLYFRVFNRWGQLLFETKAPDQKWDGTYKGMKQPLETYVWIAEGIADNGDQIVRRGQTILIR